MLSTWPPASTRLWPRAGTPTASAGSRPNSSPSINSQPTGRTAVNNEQSCPLLVSIPVGNASACRVWVPKSSLNPTYRPFNGEALRQANPWPEPADLRLKCECGGLEYIHSVLTCILIIKMVTDDKPGRALLGSSVLRNFSAASSSL